jgi:hypothetical protein
MKGFSNALKQLTPVKKPIQTANRGANGFDNPRENIDPHIKTRDISTKNISAATLIEARDLRANNSLTVSGSTIVVKDGKVGIGRNPDYLLDVYGLGSIIRFTKATVGGLLFNAGGADIQGRTAADANGDLILNRYAGNVGVGGITAPDYKLEVATNFRVSGANGRVMFGNSGIVADNAANNCYWYAGGVGGNLTIRPNGEITNPTYGQVVFRSDGLHRFWDGAGNVELYINSGEVAINSSTPQSAFHISGGRCVITNYTSNVGVKTFAGQIFVSGGALMYVGTGGTLTVLGAA